MPVDPQIDFSEMNAISDFGWDPDMSECTTRYQPGGYYFAQINDLLNERYRVLAKLGWGTYSTTWLARDKTTRDLVAVKVCISDPDISNEARTLQPLATAYAAQDTRSNQWIPRVLDSFNVQGPNGLHPCYVRVPARASIAFHQAAKPNDSNVFELHVARSLAAQVTLAVAFLHAQGYVHGDLQAPNILVQLPPNFFELSDDDLSKLYGQPEIKPVVYRKGPLPLGIPSHLTMSTFLSQLDVDDLGPYPASIMLSDFGETFRPTQEARSYTNVSLPYRAPEIAINLIDSANLIPISFPSDIWSLACLFWELFCGYSLFSVWDGSQDRLIREIVDTLGILPSDWWQKWKMRDSWYYEDGTSRGGKLLSLEQSFDKILQEYRRDYDLELIQMDEQRALLSLLKKMLALKPEQRITIEEVLKSEWMVKWALPALEKNPELPY